VLACVLVSIAGAILREGLAAGLDSKLERPLDEDHCLGFDTIARPCDTRTKESVTKPTPKSQ
jgi:hypothetical protein